MFAVVIHSLLVFAFCAVNAGETDDSLSIIDKIYERISLRTMQNLPEDTNISKHRFELPEIFAIVAHIDIWWRYMNQQVRILSEKDKTCLVMKFLVRSFNWTIA